MIHHAVGMTRRKIGVYRLVSMFHILSLLTILKGSSTWEIDQAFHHADTLSVTSRKPMLGCGLRVDIQC